MTICVERPPHDYTSWGCYGELVLTRATSSGSMWRLSAPSWSTHASVGTLALQCIRVSNWEGVQRAALRVAYPELSYELALTRTGLDTLHERRENLCMSLFANIMDPSHRLHCLFPPPRQHMYNIRDFTIYPRVGHRQRFKDALISYELANWQWLHFCELCNTCFSVIYCSLVP